MRLLISLLLLTPTLCTAQLYPIATFSDSSPPKWTEKSFSGYTDYQIIPYKSTQVLQASAVAAASGIMFEQRIDLTKTPHLNWSWQTSALLEQLNELEKSGDDFVARVYVIIDGGWMMWNTQALNYVWSSSQTLESSWDNPFAGSAAKMVAVRNHHSELNHWYHEKRNVYQDLIEQFGDKGSPRANLDAYRYIDAVAIMTDTDNSSQSAQSLYGNIWFSSE